MRPAPICNTIVHSNPMRVSVLLAALIWPAAAQETKPVEEWIASHAVPLTTPAAGHGFKDMEPLKQAVGNARIVSLGEATHGTREFFQLKHRMLEFLATEMGFSIFSIEANMPEAYRLNDFVLNGKGDPAALIHGMYFWTWDTKEVLDMVLWMRQFNQSGKGRIQFTGFDMQTPDVANTIVRDFVAKADSGYASVLAHASELARAPAAAQSAPFGTANGTFPVAKAAGKTIRFSGYIKTENVLQYAGFWWRADGDKGPLAFKDLAAAAPKGTTDWTPYDLTISIPEQTRAIYFGTLLAGSGTAWFDDLKIEIDGQPYPGDEFDFSFEGPKLKGLYPAVPAYATGLDDQAAHGGKQSLRISSRATPAAANAVDPKVAAAEWAEVLEHLKGSREQYAAHGSAKADIEWAIQNARVVLECMQMRAGQVTRDDSMAANIRWILDQLPDARMVIWAHNGHVETSPGSMGSALRRMYGSQMAIFGFAFNQGSFRAVERSAGLKNFTVPPAPAGSLDATLASAGIPLFALDLRALPKSGPVADWFHATHATRSIGAIFSDDTAASYLVPQVVPDLADGILFVEKTTAAMANPPLQASGETFDFKAAAAGGNGPVEFKDPEFAVSVAVPPRWKVGRAFRWGDHETTAQVFDDQSTRAGSLYFRIAASATHSEEAAYRLLLTKADDKAAQRIAAGWTDYQIRPGSVVRRKVGGRPAVSCIADYTLEDAKWVEYLTWVSGDNASALVFIQAPKSELDTVRRRLDPIIDTLKLP